jgi:hypothetical protein
LEAEADTDTESESDTDTESDPDPDRPFPFPFPFLSPSPRATGIAAIDAIATTANIRETLPRHTRHTRDCIFLLTADEFNSVTVGA